MLDLSGNRAGETEKRNETKRKFSLHVDGGGVDVVEARVEEMLDDTDERLEETEAILEVTEAMLDETDDADDISEDADEITDDNEDAEVESVTVASTLEADDETEAAELIVEVTSAKLSVADDISEDTEDRADETEELTESTEELAS